MYWNKGDLSFFIINKQFYCKPETETVSAIDAKLFYLGFVIFFL
jgi:hypothetical protein